MDMLELIGTRGWIPVVQGMGTTIVTLADGTPHPLSDLTPPLGQVAFYGGVVLTAQQVGAVGLSISCAPPPGKKLDPLRGK